jgi:antitoxin HicB
MIEYRVLLEKDPDGGYVAFVPSLPGCLTQGESQEEALENTREAIRCWIESAQRHGERIPSEPELPDFMVAV